MPGCPAGNVEDARDGLGNLSLKTCERWTAAGPSSLDLFFNVTLSVYEAHMGGTRSDLEQLVKFSPSGGSSAQAIERFRMFDMSQITRLYLVGVEKRWSFLQNRRETRTGRRPGRCRRQSVKLAELAQDPSNR